MSQVIFDFSELITHCLHDKEMGFTNAISPEMDSKKFVSELFQNLKSVGKEIELKELFQQEHFHFVQSPHVKEKIEKLIGKPYFKLTNLCQIPLGQEARLYGSLQKVKHTNLYRFKALILDPNHLIYHHDIKFKQLKNLTCLFSETNCLEG